MDLESVIKYENCDEMFMEPLVAPPTLTGMVDSTPYGKVSFASGPTAQKRPFDALNSSCVGRGSGGGGGDVPTDHGRYHDPVSGQYIFEQEIQIKQEPDVQYARPLQHQLLPARNFLAESVAPVKRCRRGDSQFIFTEPFFELPKEYHTVGTGSIISARCLTCNVNLRGNKNVSSNFLKHLKRVHPEVYKIYERMKVRRGRKHTLTASNAALAASNHPMFAEEQSYFDASTFLEPTTSNAATEEINSRTADETLTPPSLFRQCAENVGTASASPIVPGQSPCTSEINDPIQLDFTKNMCSIVNNLMEEKMKSFITRSEIEKVTNHVTSTLNAQFEKKLEAISKLNGVSTLQIDMLQLKQECKELRAKLEQFELSKQKMRNEFQMMDTMLRQHKFVVCNIAVENPQNPRDTVEKLLKTQLHLPTIELKSVAIISRNRPGMHGKQNLLVELKNGEDAHAIFRNSFKLKNTGIYIERSMSMLARKRKEKLKVLRRELLRRNAELRVGIRHLHVIVQGKRFYWDEVDGLCQADTSINSLPIDAIDQLKSVTGLDLTEFINVLKNYDVQLR